MNDKKVGLSDTMKAKTEPKSFQKNPIPGTKFTIAISSAKGGVGKSTFATNLALALKKVGWKDLDFIIVDMPPGTGDTQLTFAQEINVDGAIIISTPQEIALQDVKRGIRMFDKLKVNIIGLIDNMSHFIGDDGKKYTIFGENGVERTAKEFEKKFLGRIPINADVGKYCDMGIPIVEKDPDHEITKIYLEFAEKVKQSFL